MKKIWEAELALGELFKAGTAIAWVALPAGAVILSVGTTYQGVKVFARATVGPANWIYRFYLALSDVELSPGAVDNQFVGTVLGPGPAGQAIHVWSLGATNH